MVDYEVLSLVSAALTSAQTPKEWRQGEKEKKEKEKKNQRQKEEPKSDNRPSNFFCPFLHEKEDQPVGIMDASCASVPKPAPD